MKSNEFEQEKNLKLLHKNYQQQSTELPASSLDEVILQAAHNAVDSTSVIRKTKKGKRAWYVPVSFVAVLVLSLSVFLKLAFEPQVMQPRAMDGEFSLPMSSNVSEPVSSNTKKEALAIKLRAVQSQALSEREKHKKSMTKRRKMQESESVAQYSRQMLAPSSLSNHELDKDVKNIPVIKEADSDPSGIIDHQQKNKTDYLMRLLNAGEINKLRIELLKYRTVYPYRKTGDSLPETLRALELKWKLEKTDID